MYEDFWQLIESTVELSNVIRRIAVPTVESLTEEQSRFRFSKPFFEPLLYPVELRENWLNKTIHDDDRGVEYHASEELKQRFAEIQERLRDAVDKKAQLQDYLDQIDRIRSELNMEAFGEHVPDELDTFQREQKQVISVLDRLDSMNNFLDKYGLDYWVDRIREDIDMLLEQGFLSTRWTGRNWRPTYYENVKQFSRNRYNRSEYEDFLAEHRKFNKLYEQFVNAGLDMPRKTATNLKEVKAALYKQSETDQSLSQAKTVANNYQFSFTNAKGALIHGTPIWDAEWSIDDFLSFPQTGLQTKSKPGSHKFFNDTISFFLITSKEQIIHQIKKHGEEGVVYIVLQPEWISKHADQFYYSQKADRGNGYKALCEEYGFTAIQDAPRSIRDEKGWSNNGLTASVEFWQEEVQSIKPVPYDAIKAFLCENSFVERLTYFMKALGRREPSLSRPIYALNGEKLWP